MNYIQLINDFWVSHEIYSFRPNDVAIYFYLVKVCNAVGWKGDFERNSTKIMSEFEIKDRRTLQSSLDKLASAGLIVFKTKNKSAVIKFSLLSKNIKTTAFNVEDDVVDDVEDDAVDDVEDDALLNINKNININNPSIYPPNRGDIGKKRKKGDVLNFEIPTELQVAQYCTEKNISTVDAKLFISYYEVRGWRLGNGAAPVRDWRKIVDYWAAREDNNQQKKSNYAKDKPKYQSMAERLREESDAAKQQIISDFANNAAESGC